jgi:hypothetical protein
LTAGQTGAEQAQQSALTGMLTRQKLDDARRARDIQENISRILTGGQQAAPAAGGEITPDMALAAPVTPELPAGPTVARAGMIGQAAPAAPAMTANEMQAQRYRQAANVYTASGRTEDAKRMIDIAEQLAPTRQEVVGDIYRGEGGKFFQRTKTGGVIEVPGQMAPAPKPIGSRETVTDLATGKEVIVQGYDDGSFKTLEGFGPKRDMVLQTVDGKTVAIDRSQVVAGETFGTGMSPLDYARLQIEREQLDIAKARLKISQQEFDNKKYERADTPTGIVFYPTTPEGGPVIPLLDAEGKPVMGAVAEQLKIDRERLQPERIRILSAFGIEPTEENLRKFERKPMGQPQSVTELASGKQVLMQQFDDGTYQTVGGFGPPRRIEKVSLGGRVQFVDMNAVQPGSSLAMSLAPQVVGGAESGYYVVGGGGGGAAPAAAQRAPAAAAGAPAAGAPAGAAAAPARVAGPQPLIPGTGKGFTQEKDLRSEFDKAAKPFVELSQAYQKIETAAKNPSGAGDISLVYGYMKILDPGSVVREGEFATAANAGGVSDAIRSLYNRALQGERLSDNVRTDFLGQARNIIESQRVLSNDLQERFRELSKQYDLNADRVVFDPFKRVRTPSQIINQSTTKPGGAAGSPPAAPPAAGTGTNLPTTQRGFFDRFNLIPR